MTATDAAELTRLTRKTVNDLYPGIRRRLAEASARAAAWTPGEADKAYVGARRVRDKPGRGAGDKTPVLGLRKRQGRVYTEVVPNCPKAALQQVIRGRGPLGSVLHTDMWGAPAALTTTGWSTWATASTTACATPAAGTPGASAARPPTSTTSRASGRSPSRTVER